MWVIYLTADDIYDDVVNGFGRRKFAAGLAVSFIDFLESLKVPENLDIGSFDDFLKVYPRQVLTAAGGHANQLIIDLPGGGTLGLRPFYNAVENLFRAQNHRFDYPSCAPHATQAWQDYVRWLDGLCACDPAKIAALRKRIVEFVLATLPDQAFDPATFVKEPPLFESVISDFDLTRQAGELSGAAYQGLVFGFLRADNPHLQVEIDKVRTGSKRLQRVGDIDAWEGSRLAITAEVKQYVLGEPALDLLAAFCNAALSRGAIAVVASLGYEPGVREKIDALGAHALDREDLLRIVGLWDPVKQRVAVSSMAYYVKHVEKNSALGARLDAFLADLTNPPAAVPGPAP